MLCSNSSKAIPHNSRLAAQAPLRRLRHGICVAKMLDNVGLRYLHRASGAKAPRTLRPLPLLRFAVSATGGAHLCSIQYYLRFWLSSCRTSLAVSALRIMRYCPEFIIQAIAIKIQSIPVFWCRIFAEHAWQQSLKTGNFFARFYFPLFSAYRGTFLGKKTSCTDWGPTNAGSLSFWT